jgi:hypothetical protein
VTFRSTEDTEHVAPTEAARVKEIASMLFLKDGFRIHSASYAIIPYVDLNNPGIHLSDLANIQAIVAYLYASPHDVFGHPFLSSEHATMAILSPGRISIYLVRPTFHVEATELAAELTPDSRSEVEGYTGLYNFRHHFWVTKGSRLYGPKPDMTLNISQDLSDDLERASHGRPDYRLLLGLLRKPKTAMSSRVFTALRWFNAANDEANDDLTAIINLAVAFESLLSLPADEKTDRLIDAIALLLGRIPRIDVWARQFYDTRSRIVHEGLAEHLHFIAVDRRGLQKKTDGPMYRSLLSFGRQIFQLCLGTVLVGADLAEKAGLEEKLVTNQERFVQICKILSDEAIGACEQLKQVAPIVAAVERYRFVSESGLKIDTMIGSIRLIAKALLGCECGLTEELKNHLEAFIASKRTNDHFNELDALRVLDESFPDGPCTLETPYIQTVRELVKVVWGYVFIHYYWLKERQPSKDGKA